MVREWRELARGGGGGGDDVHGGLESLISSGVMVLWVALIGLLLISAVIFSCADGASKDKASATNNDTYNGSTCGGCGAACGA